MLVRLKTALGKGLVFGLQWGAALFVIACFAFVAFVGAGDYFSTRTRAAKAEAFIEQNADVWRFVGQAYSAQKAAQAAPAPPSTSAPVPGK